MIYERNTVRDGPGFMLKIVSPPDDRGKPVVGIYDLNPDAFIKRRMGRADMLKVAMWFFVNAWRSA
ncbi:hypothetical protein [Aureimonas glaciei]|uniref:Uncharacterized protein n=1 Tax=Aureimonas glaciei TaxID=1776957 RepID=A0A916YFV5_9HYPH|nr:hypothetical protein [Aureimonas glaciei]GGD43047.1 hypothetical protein GCM10011335_52130 [Aureimonas glaciei]